MKAFIILNVLITIIIILRSLLEGKVTRRFQYAMWLFLPIYIVLSCVISIPINSSAVPSSRIDRNISRSFMATESQIRNNEDIASMYHDRIVELEENAEYSADVDANTVSLPADNNVISDSEVHTTGNNLHTITWIKIIYVLGMLSAASVFVINNITFCIKIRKNRQFYEKSVFGNLSVYKLDEITVPFLYGKSIYVPADLNESDKRYDYAICHEYSHYKQGDAFWPVVKYALMTLLWFDPLVWAACVLIERDSEMAADENVIRTIGTSGKRTYSEMLLEYAVSYSSSRKLIASTSVIGKSHSFIRTRVKNIIYDTRKSTACFLASAIFLTSFVGCSLINTDKKVPKISSDDKWYSYSSFDMKSDYQGSANPLNYYDCQNWSLGKYNDEFVQLVKVYSDDAAEQVTLLEFFDEDGEKTHSVDIASYIENCEADFAVLDAVRNRDNISIVTFEKEYIYSLESDAIVDDVISEESADINVHGGHFTLDTTAYTLELDDITVNFTYVNDSINYYVISIIYANGYIETIDLRTALRGVSLQQIGAVLPYDDTNIVFIGINGGMNRYYKLNTVNGEIDELTGDDVAFLSDYYFRNLSYLGDTNELIGINNTGFFKIDLVNRSVEKMFDWNWCTFDRTLFMCPKIVELTDNRISVMESDSYGDNSYCLILTRENSNPNAGKYILTIDGLSLSAQVTEFNRTDDMYFIEIDNRYSAEGLLSGTFSSLDDVEMYYNEVLRVEQALSNQMAVDLMAGDSPDLICDAYSSSQLLNSDLLYDLSDLISNDEEYDESMYFQNVIEASRVNNKLLYMPLTFGVNAIGTVNPDYSEVEGFTYDEYREFVSNVCNGKDPIAYRRFQFIENLMPSTLPYCFNEEGKINFDNEAFRELLTYAANDFHARNEEMDMFEYKIADSMRICSIGEYLTRVAYKGWNYNNVNLISYPNHTGSGLSVNIESSVSISANARDVDGCYRFIRFVMNHNLSAINREAFIRSQEQSLESYNRECDYYNAMAEETGMSVSDMPSITAGSDMVDYYRTVIERCEYVNYSDPAINLIVYEESQAYFAGDKTIDEVIVIMNDRAQTVLNERG